MISQYEHEKSGLHNFRAGQKPTARATSDLVNSFVIDSFMNSDYHHAACMQTAIRSRAPQMSVGRRTGEERRSYGRFFMPRSVTRIPVLIVGAGLMGRWHLATAQSLGARVVAIVDPDIAAAERLKRHAPDALVASDLDSALSATKVDTAHICSPVDTHYSLVKKLISAGVHGLVEKPLTETAEQTRDLLFRSASADVKLCPVHQYAFQHPVEQLVVAGDQLKAFRRIDFEICSAGADTLLTDRDRIVADILPHPLSIIQRVFPELSVNELDWSLNRVETGELLATAESGALLITIFISLSVRPTRFEVRFRGPRGAIDLNGFHGFAVELGGKASRIAKITHPFATAAKTFTAASINLASRLGRREFAYAGLRRLTQQFYCARDRASVPITDQQILAIAEVRDAFLARIADASFP